MAREPEYQHRVVPIYLGLTPDADSIPYGLRLKIGKVLSNPPTREELEQTSAQLLDLSRSIAATGDLVPARVQHPVQRSASQPLLAPKRRVEAFAFTCVGLFLLSAFAAAFWGPRSALALALAPMALAFAARDRVFAKYARHTRLQIGVLTALYASVGCYLLPPTAWSTAAAARLTQLRLLTVSSAWPLGAVITFAVMLTGIVLVVSLHRREIVQPLRNPITADVGDRGFERSLIRYCTALTAFLDRFDREVNWSDNELTPLEAEVEAEQASRLRPRIETDLVEAIRGDRSSAVFLVLGDPGSGKSVSLRRLVRLLCSQARASGIVPVYANLREYPVGEAITVDSLIRFAKRTASSQTGRDGRDFIETWYEEFRTSGRLFFIIDSFDEIPAVLDSDDRSESHRRISETFDRFFTQEIQSCRAVLASRLFRAPVGMTATRLVVRPFTESQIRRAMETWLLGRGIDGRKYVRRLFRERPHLVPLLRNPLTAELIAEYARSSAGERLPDNMFAVFDQYLSQRFEGDLLGTDRVGIDAHRLREAAGRIARWMYDNPNVGLEAETEHVRALLELHYGDASTAIIEALRYARIARGGGPDNRNFAFVHRRFSPVSGACSYHRAAA